MYQTVSEKLGQMEKATPDLDPDEDPEERSWLAGGRFALPGPPPEQGKTQ